MDPVLSFSGRNIALDEKKRAAAKAFLLKRRGILNFLGLESINKKVLINGQTLPTESFLLHNMMMKYYYYYTTTILYAACVCDHIHTFC